jgi:predicted XRE-type DNA-binding protein
MKPIVWLGDSLERMRDFPGEAKRDAGYQLEREGYGMTEKLKRVRGSGNVFRDIGFGKAEAESLKLRSELMMRIDNFYRRSGMTQAEAARELGLTQPRLNALLKGKIGLFSLDALVDIAARAGLNVRLVVKKAA